MSKIEYYRIRKGSFSSFGCYGEDNTLILRYVDGRLVEFGFDWYDYHDNLALYEDERKAISRNTERKLKRLLATF